MASGNAKRRQKQQHQKQQSANKQHKRDHEQSHTHLPKVGSPEDDAYIQRKRREDLIDFGLTSGRTRQILGIVLAVFAIGALLAWFLFL
jgi:ferric-dicitrate binding protein FerR (iron transport regulator)